MNNVEEMRKIIDSMLVENHIQRTKLNAEEFERRLNSAINDTQREALEQCRKFGWTVKSVLSIPDSDNVAVGLSSKQGGGWLMPNGKIKRAAINQTTAKMDLDDLK